MYSCKTRLDVKKITSFIFIQVVSVAGMIFEPTDSCPAKNLA
jgi:hypothetical protein